MRHWPCENFIRDSQVACAGPARREEVENGCESEKCASAGWTEKVKNVHAGWNYGFYSTGCATTAVDPSRPRDYVRCSSLIYWIAGVFGAALRSRRLQPGGL